MPPLFDAIVLLYHCKLVNDGTEKISAATDVLLFTFVLTDDGTDTVGIDAVA